MTRERAITQVAKLSDVTVRAMLVDLLSFGGSDDVVADGLLTTLHADPDRALRVLDQLRIAGPWNTDVNSARRYDAAGSDSECLSYVFRNLDTGRWFVVGGNGGDTPYPTLAEAQAAEDARLTSEGWALASGGGE